MRDLLLWRALVSGQPLGDELVPLLEMLSERPLAMRAPMFAGLVRACRDARPAVRAAAVAALCGGTGHEAVAAVVRCLGDDEPAVWKAAVRVLVANADPQPLRFVHALFHRNPEVRRAAIGAVLPERVRLLTLPLLADPECRDTVRASFPADLVPGREEILLILGLHGAGDVSASIAGELLSRVACREILGAVADSIVSKLGVAQTGVDANADEATRLLHELADPAAEAADSGIWADDPRWEGADLLASALRLAEADQSRSLGESDGLDRLLVGVAEVSEAERAWLAVACCRRLLSEEIELTDAMLAVRGLVAAWPQAALWTWLPVEWRRRGCRVFLDIDTVVFKGWKLTDSSGPFSPDRWLAAIDASCVASECGELVDLRALAGLGRLLGDDALSAVRGQFGRQRLCDAVLVPGGTVLLRLTGCAKSWARFTHEFLSRHGDTPEATACLLPFLNDTTLGLLDGVGPDQMVTILGTLQQLSPQPPVRDPRGKRLRRIIAKVVERLSSGGGPSEVGAESMARQAERLAGLFAGWWAGPRGPLDRFFHAIFRGLNEPPMGAVFAMAIDAFPPEKREELLRAMSAWEEFSPRPPRQPDDDRTSLATATPRTLTPTDLRRLRQADIDKDWQNALGALLGCSTIGLATRLSGRRLDAHPFVAVPILLTHDPIDIVDTVLARAIADDEADLVGRIDARLGESLAGLPADALGELPLQTHLWRAAWEAHAACAMDRLREQAGDGSPLAWLAEVAGGMSCGALAGRCFRFVRQQLQAARVRDRELFLELASPRLAVSLVAGLGRTHAVEAATVLAAWHACDAASPELAAQVSAVNRLLPDLACDVRAALEPWVSSRGLPGAEDGDRGADLEAARFARMLVEGRSADALEVAAGESPTDWFRGGHWDALTAAGLAEDAVARRLATASQPYAVIRAVETLLTEPVPTDDDRAAIEGFLEQGDRRLASLRLEAARCLSDAGNPVGLPVLLTEMVSSRGAEAARHPWGVPMLRCPGEEPSRPSGLFRGASPEAVRDAVRSVIAALTAGASNADHEKSLHAELLAPVVDNRARSAGMAELIAHGTTRKIVDAAIGWHRRSASMDDRIRSVAKIFAWGVRRGRELAGRTLTFEMIADNNLGYTSLDSGRVAINILPILHGVPDGEAIVRGLVIHEIGHHVYHVSPEHRESAARAGKERIHKLLNLVNDEHLERNLRAARPSFSDPLKRLNAYAFQHFDRVIGIPVLLKTLGRHAASVLVRTRLAAGPGPGSVVVKTGSLLRALSKQGSAFARFIRVLRMGLGQRDPHPQVAAGLALFGRGFRASSADELLRIARELRRIFGDEAALLDMLELEHSPLHGDAADPVRVGEGLTPAQLRKEVEAISGDKPRKPTTRRPHHGQNLKNPRFDCNLSDEERFHPISRVVPVPFDAAASRECRRVVLPSARRLRRFLVGLGLGTDTVRPRLQGRSLDRGRLAALAAVGEPRVMIARRFVPRNDLFMGVAIDCSASMSQGSRFPKAVAFGEMLAEASRGLPGVDLRVIGFDDTTIFDAGTAEACAAHGLELSGGNNDAAALWHLASLAISSRRSGKLLIMISDGMPTECSVKALRLLVNDLARRHRIACAQVAVAAIEEVSFPTFLEVESLDIAAAAGQLGQTVARLVQRTRRGGG